MARFIAIILLVATLWGCQAATPSTSLPALTFDGPQLVAAPILPNAAVKIITAGPADNSAQQTAAVVAAAHRSASDSTVPNAWVPQVPERDWQWIVIHHSATSWGSAAVIDQWHRDRGFDELGYHFVIDNGSVDCPDGQIEVGPRWVKQKWGAHTKTADNRFNDFGIGICLVGNFDEDHPTPSQMKSAARLVAYLMRTYHIRPDHVIGHGDAKPTDCPGRYMSVAEVRRMAENILAGEGENTNDGALAATDELIHDQPSN